MPRKQSPLPPGETLRAYRESQGWSQSGLAARLGCRKSLVSDVECGTRTPSLEWWHKTATTIGLDPSKLDKRLASNA